MKRSIRTIFLVLAPMAGFGTVDLAAAVSNAGGLGSIGCAVMAPELVAKTVAEHFSLVR
jgi:nitronate monooxygenase